MPGATALPVEERILQLLQSLGIDQAHFAGRTPADWTGLATTHPEVFCSFILVGPLTTAFPIVVLYSLFSYVI